ncbi:MAG: CdaR family protein [Sedimentibacter sp.]|uniref:CdaR family protein n=1 Tax=Sedimentibacter sp. TaxID=1960295 RepID=UPI002981E891|nr:CdaR family protein [Sedimentibacter sp.]MDW5298596.1 CdaR family protein [Sedimentibacter sp.]
MKIKNDKLIIQITCLIVSVILWMVIMVETNPLYENNYTSIPVTIRNLPALSNSNLVMMNTDKDNLTVNVKVKGTIEELKKISKSDFSAYIDVLGYGEGITNANIEVIGPSNVEIISNHPSQIACNIESIISRVMDVTVQFEGTLSENYYKSLASLNISSVKITGPRSVVNSANLAVATVNVDGAKEDIVKTVPVRIYDGKDTEIFMSVPISNVEVSVPVYPTKYVNLIPSVTGTPDEGYQLVNVTVKPEKVRIAARQDILDTIKELNLEELDITGAFNNILSSKEILNTDGLTILDLTTTPVVNAAVEKVIEKELVFTSSDIQFINLKEGRQINLTENEEITVTVSGTSSIVNALKKSDLVLSANLAEAAVGQNTISIECVTEESFKSITLSKDSVNVEVIEKALNTEVETYD